MPRLDVYLNEAGLAKSRSLAAKLISEGFVTVNGALCVKPSREIFPGDNVAIRDNPLTRFVSRGGLKLEAALDAFSIEPARLVCADIGASTGGFTDCLLQRGAAKVYAIDSGTAQLVPKLREDARVIVMENTNARFLDETAIEPVDLTVMDVSFISQTLLYPALFRILKPAGNLIALIKPQFEVGKENLGSGGVVRNPALWDKAVEKCRRAAAEYGFLSRDVIPSPIAGGDGNREFLALFAKQGDNA